jgi:NADH dehydrogenase/NADH:ubiquinone oxidoreductase subunit G
MASVKKPEVKVSIEVNGVKTDIVSGEILLKAIKNAGFKVPTLCHHKDLKPHGNCRLCMVEIESKTALKNL